MTDEIKTEHRVKPRKWEHKENKKVVRALPWWECLPGTEIKDKDMDHPIPNVAWKFGMLVQVGWLLENEHGVWLGVGPKAAESFTDLGECE